jgi:uncharacterized protein
MNSREDVRDFVGQKTLAIVGMSRAPRSFSAYAAKELKKKGYRLFFVNPNSAEIQGGAYYPSVAALPERVGGALFLTPPTATEKAVREAAEAGVTRMWIQQGAESEEALAFCQEKSISVVSGHCILMFAEPVGSAHRFHRWLKGLFGGLPK